MSLTLGQFAQYEVALNEHKAYLQLIEADNDNIPPSSDKDFGPVSRAPTLDDKDRLDDRGLAARQRDRDAVTGAASPQGREKETTDVYVNTLIKSLTLIMKFLSDTQNIYQTLYHADPEDQEIAHEDLKNRQADFNRALGRIDKYLQNISKKDKDKEVKIKQLMKNAQTVIGGLLSTLNTDALRMVIINKFLDKATIKAIPDVIRFFNDENKKRIQTCAFDIEGDDPDRPWRMSTPAGDFALCIRAMQKKILNSERISYNKKYLGTQSGKLDDGLFVNAYRTLYDKIDNTISSTTLTLPSGHASILMPGALDYEKFFEHFKTLFKTRMLLLETDCLLDLDQRIIL